MNDAPKKNSTPSALHIKRTARQLFAERGVDGVTVRDIAIASGQKNHAALVYYFKTKDQLVREIVLDGAKLIDGKRNAMLDALESEQADLTLLGVVNALISPAVSFGDPEDMAGFARFYFLLEMTHREFVLEILDNKWNSGYMRCINHLRDLMPDAPDSIKTQKLVFVGRYIGAVLSARETQLDDHSRVHPLWEDKATLEHFAKTMVAILEAPYE